MARQDRIEIEITLAGESRHRTAHGETVANGHNADFGLVKLVDERHVGENIRVAHMIERRRILEVEHKAIRVSKRLLNAVFRQHGGRMKCIDEGNCKTFMRQRAARIAGVKLFHALTAKP